MRDGHPQEGLDVARTRDLQLPHGSGGDHFENVLHNMSAQVVHGIITWGVGVLAGGGGAGKPCPSRERASHRRCVRGMALQPCGLTHTTRQVGGSLTEGPSK